MACHPFVSSGRSCSKTRANGTRCCKNTVANCPASFFVYARLAPLGAELFIVRHEGLQQSDMFCAVPTELDLEPCHGCYRHFTLTELKIFGTVRNRGGAALLLFA